MVQWYNTGSAMPPILTFEINQKQISKSLACLLIFLYLCNAFEMQLRVWAAAQQRPSKLASAFALHHTCNGKPDEKGVGTTTPPVSRNIRSERSVY